MVDEVVEEIREKLKEKAKPLDEESLKRAKQFLGPDLLPYGVKLADVWKICAEVYRRHKDELDLKAAWQIGDKLFSSSYQEEKMAAFGLIYHFREDFDQNTLPRFESWIEKYVHNWGVCDSFCIRVIGPYLAKNSDLLLEIEKWAASSNLWVQRASLVATLKTAKDLENPKFIFLMAEKFMESQEPFLQKATGWLLKESSKYFPDEVVDFLLKWKPKTSRLVLRYATEKMDERRRRIVLA